MTWPPAARTSGRSREPSAPPGAAHSTATHPIPPPAFAAPPPRLLASGPRSACLTLRSACSYRGPAAGGGLPRTRGFPGEHVGQAVANMPADLHEPRAGAVLLPAVDRFERQVISLGEFRRAQVRRAVVAHR